MKRTSNCFVLAFLLFTTQVLAQQQAREDTWARYKPDRLSNVIKVHTYTTEAPADGVDVQSDPVRTRVTYTGISRRTIATKRRFIALYMKSISTPEVAKNFMTELLFIENGVEFWLPVKDALLPSFGKELHKGESVTLFANWVGISYPERGGSKIHVFLVNKFEKLEGTTPAQPADYQWTTLTSPDKDFTIDFPVEPKRDEFRNKRNMGEVGRLVRWYRAYTDKLMFVIGFEDLNYAPNSPFADSVAPAYEQKIRDAARERGWKLIRMQRLSNSVAELEAWERSIKPTGYVHTISRTIVRNGHAYDLQCRSTFIGQVVDRNVCRHFFNSFRILGPPQ